MTDLSELIKYWENSYAINYIQRHSLTNQRILDTITYLKQLLLIKDGGPSNLSLLKSETEK